MKVLWYWPYSMRGTCKCFFLNDLKNINDTYMALCWIKCYKLPINYMAQPGGLGLSWLCCDTMHDMIRNWNVWINWTRLVKLPQLCLTNHTCVGQLKYTICKLNIDNFLQSIDEIHCARHETTLWPLRAHQQGGTGSSIGLIMMFHGYQGMGS